MIGGKGTGVAQVSVGGEEGDMSEDHTDLPIHSQWVGLQLWPSWVIGLARRGKRNGSRKFLNLQVLCGYRATLVKMSRPVKYSVGIATLVKMSRPVKYSVGIDTLVKMSRPVKYSVGIDTLVKMSRPVKCFYIPAGSIAHKYTSLFYRRGLIMGIWNSNISIGNILGTVIPSIWATCDGPWGWSFVVPGFIIIGVSVPVFLLLVIGTLNLKCVVCLLIWFGHLCSP